MRTFMFLLRFLFRINVYVESALLKMSHTIVLSCGRTFSLYLSFLFSLIKFIVLERSLKSNTFLFVFLIKSFLRINNCSFSLYNKVFWFFSWRHLPRLIFASVLCKIFLRFVLNFNPKRVFFVLRLYWSWLLLLKVMLNDFIKSIG